MVQNAQPQIHYVFRFSLHPFFQIFILSIFPRIEKPIRQKHHSQIPFAENNYNYNYKIKVLQNGLQLQFQLYHRGFRLTTTTSITFAHISHNVKNHNKTTTSSAI